MLSLFWGATSHVVVSIEPSDASSHAVGIFAPAMVLCFGQGYVVADGPGTTIEPKPDNAVDSRLWRPSLIHHPAQLLLTLFHCSLLFEYTA